MGETGIALAILGMLAAGGIVYAASKPAAPAAAPGTAPPPPAPSSACGGALPAGYSWQVAQSLTHRAHVRISMTPQDFQTVAMSMNLSTTLAGWTALLAMPQVVAVFGSNVCAWAPGDALPEDWPGDDIDEATEYHAEFVYPGQVAIPTSGLPFPAKVWMAQLSGIKIGPLPGGPPKPVAGPSTTPQMAHLVAPGGEVDVDGTLPGTLIRVTIDGGFFEVVNAYENILDLAGQVSGTKGVPGYPTGPIHNTWFPFVTTGKSGGLNIQWSDASGTTYYTTLKYA